MPRPISLPALLIAGLAFSTTACSRSADTTTAAPDGAASTEAATQDWSSLKGFTAIDATGPDDVTVTIADDFAIRAEGDAKAIADLEMTVKNGKLVIGRKSKGNWSWGRNDAGKGVTIHVAMPAITAAALTGAGDFNLDRAEGDTLDLALTGAGDFKIGTVKLKKLTTDITGAGSMRIAGTADEGKLSVTGAGDIDGEGLTLGSADVSILGAGDIDFASDGKVAISIVGPGNVTVKGKAQCTTSGTGPGEAHCGP